MHIQDIHSSSWDDFNDENHIQGLFNSPPQINPAWLKYLAESRPNVLIQYFKLCRLQGDNLEAALFEVMKQQGYGN